MFESLFSYFGYFMYIAPLLAVPFILKDHTRFWFSLLILFTAPAIGEITWLLITGFRNSSAQLWPSFISFYIFAIFPFGFWAAIIAAFSVSILSQISDRYRPKKQLLFIGSLSIGGVIGGFFMGLVFILTQNNSQVSESVGGFFEYTFAGVTAGGVSGIFCPLFIKQG